MVFVWWKELEETLLELWQEVKVRTQKKMKTEKEKREWVLERLKEKNAAGELTKGGGEGGDIKLLNVDILKNKLDGLKKTGKRLLEKHVAPRLRKMDKDPGTGAAVPSDDEDEDHGVDPIQAIDWGAVVQCGEAVQMPSAQEACYSA